MEKLKYAVLTTIISLIAVVPVSLPSLSRGTLLRQRSWPKLSERPISGSWTAEEVLKLMKRDTFLAQFTLTYLRNSECQARVGSRACGGCSKSRKIFLDGSWESTINPW